jgi:hypothetical protein
VSLSDWDKAIIDRLAHTYRVKGKEHAKKAYSNLALANGWHGTPMWMEGRTFFKEQWYAHRREFNNSTKLGFKVES